MKNLKTTKLLTTALLCLFSVSLSFAQTPDLITYREGNKWGYINKRDSIVISAKYNYVNLFSEGLAAVRIDELFGYINAKGETIIDFKYEFADNFKDGQARVSMLPEGAIVTDPDLPGYIVFGNIIDKKGKPLLKWKYNYIAEFHEGLAMVYKGTYRDHISGYINKELKLVINLKYQKAENFNNDVAIVTKENKMFLINTKGEVISEKFDRIKPFYDEKAKVKLNDKWGYIDKNGNEYFKNYK
ncbi:MAG: WG repeat-containing protein [Bacteroidales bacterium]|nr:WG repeat-containing protein [Bacteroidales bacterium]